MTYNTVVQWMIWCQQMNFHTSNIEEEWLVLKSVNSMQMRKILSVKTKLMEADLIFIP